MAASQMINVAETQLPVRSGEVGGISRTWFVYFLCLVRIFFSTNCLTLIASVGKAIQNEFPRSAAFAEFVELTSFSTHPTF